MLARVLNTILDGIVFVNLVLEQLAAVPIKNQYFGISGISATV